MHRNWRGRYRNNWYGSRGRGRPKTTNFSDNTSNSCASARVPSTTVSSRLPTSQLPIVIPIPAGNIVWKLYFPTEGL